MTGDDLDTARESAGGKPSGETRDRGDGTSDRGHATGAKSDGDDNKAAEEAPAPLKNPKVRIALIIGAVVLMLIGAIWFYNYWTKGRYEQSTNDAYLQADIVSIAPKVSGYVEQVLVADNQDVAAGQPLVRINPRDTQAKLEQSLAQVAEGRAAVKQAHAQIRQQLSQVAQARAQADKSSATLHYSQVQVDRYAPLAASGAQTAEQLDQMRQTRDESAAQLAVNRAQAEAARRQIATLQAQADTGRAQIGQADAQVRLARTDLQSTLIRSSIAGRIGDRTVRVGQYVQPGTRLMSVVPVTSLYIVANFKETQVGLMRAGQPATITVDAINGGEFHGTVESFAPGTGSQFSVLAPQNATGNFTKVVQRVSVRVRLEAGAEARRVLIPGLSAEVVVDTIGAKLEAERIKQEAKRTEDRRKREHDAAVDRDRETRQAGAGQ